jgi:hypothetical protein
MKNNVSRRFEPRHVIADTRISSDQCSRCDVSVTLCARDLHAMREISKVTQNKRAARHIHVKNLLAESTFVSRVRKTAKKSSLAEKFFSRGITVLGFPVDWVSLYWQKSVCSLVSYEFLHSVV